MFKSIKNIILYLELIILKIFTSQPRKGNGNYLFINTGQLGDLLVSSLLLENDEYFKNDKELYLLVQLKYKELFLNYKGKIKLIYFDYNKFRFNIFYKLKLISYLKNLSLKYCYNLSPARGMITDELSILSSAEYIYTICTNYLYTGKYWAKKLNKHYTNLLFSETDNYYDKHFLLLRMLNEDINTEFSFNKNKLYNDFISGKLLEKYKLKKKDYILLAPMTNDMKRSWGVDNFKKLVEFLSKSHKVVLMGSETETTFLKQISGESKDIITITPPLNEIFNIMSSCKFYIGNHSGLSHFALKSGIPFLVIVDGGFFGMYMPYDENNPNYNYIYNKLDCFGCQMHCIYNESFCLTQISLDSVINKLTAIFRELKI